MGLLRRISQERERQITAPARALIEEDEEILEWARARNPDGRGHGFVYITPRRVIVCWRGRTMDSKTVEWSRIRTWGLDQEAVGGPLLGLESDDEHLFVQMRVLTPAMAHNLASFVRRFSELAPRPASRIVKPLHSGEFRFDSSVEIRHEKRSLAGKTKRIIVTVIGAILVVGGILITPLPGPWSFPIVLGGLAILASEYDWAADALDWAREKYRQAKEQIKRRRAKAE